MILPSNLGETIPVICNTGDGEMLANIRSASSLSLPWLQVSEPLHGRALIVGGGPSVRAYLPAVKSCQERGDIVFAINGTMGMLNEIGVTPDYFVLLDARELNVKFLSGEAKHYMISAQCHPRAFEALSGKTVTKWLPHYEGATETVKDDPAAFECALIGGGTTVGLQSLSIAFALGYRDIHLYGFDSSYSNTAHHAYPQPQNDGERVDTFYVGSKSFQASPWMARQAMEFQTCAAQLAEADGSVSVHGNGLLPEIARVMAEGPDEILDAVYDLSKAPASYDFVTWLANAEMVRKRGGHKRLRVSFLSGPNEGFRDDNLPTDTAYKRQMKNEVMVPALLTIGAEEGQAKEGWQGAYMSRPLFDGLARGETLPKMKAPEWAKTYVQGILGGRHPIVITLREAEHWPSRNSDLNAWEQFARGRDVVFVRDTRLADKPMDGFKTFPDASKNLEIRLALYEEASLNMLSTNGPGILLWLSDNPFIQFKLVVPGYVAGTEEWIENNIGFKVGAKFPFGNSHQMICWEDDTFEAITKAYDEFAGQLMARAG